ncbi:YceI family protein [Campylobacter geochelonis]|uniref:Periplasmic protein n=1 Tax=Campylobacter geochelonis TaxID=1780362 RepID=A0A128EHS8_9BACT|nr:YceI family protein [Campylobacter geochelonis]QKF71416.1 YceI-like domain-containing periplasmic protein [Campylobacter geochelonis]CZE48384.1 periplasmic protein [Campylobacter geochelonis]
MKKILASVAVSSLILAGTLNAAEFGVDKVHSDVGFKVKHLQISNVKGKFKDYSAVIDLDTTTQKLNKLEATIKVASVDTDNSKRDEHLRSADFFDAAKFTDMKFVMTEFVADKDDIGEGKVKGNLTIKDVTLPVVLDYEFGGVAKMQDGKEKVGFNLEGEIDRTRFGVGEASVAVSSEIKIQIEIEASAK